MTVAQLLKHDFSKGSLHLYDAGGNQIYVEDSRGAWYKQEYDTNGNRIYAENSKGNIIDKRPKKDSCDGKVVDIDGKQYKLTEV